MHARAKRRAKAISAHRLEQGDLHLQQLLQQLVLEYAVGPGRAVVAAGAAFAAVRVSVAVCSVIATVCGVAPVLPKWGGLGGISPCYHRRPVAGIPLGAEFAGLNVHCRGLTHRWSNTVDRGNPAFRARC